MYGSYGTRMGSLDFSIHKTNMWIDRWAGRHLDEFQSNVIDCLEQRKVSNPAIIFVNLKTVNRQWANGYNFVDLCNI
jgi:hypothetical protein